MEMECVSKAEVLKILDKPEYKGIRLEIECMDHVNPTMLGDAKWIIKKSMIYCSECAMGFDAVYLYDFKFCPECGRRMKY